MMSTQFARFIHLSTTRVTLGASKSNLAKLRKKTGYPFGNCKKALEANNNDLEKAEKWLEDQAKALGWSKAMKMESRNTLQGLVGIAQEKQYAAMVEINCETDFVSRNEKFQKLVDVVAKTCLQHTKITSSSTKSISKVFLEGEELGKLLATDKQSLADHVVKSIAFVGERLVLRRAAMITVQPPMQLAAFTHPATGSPNISTLLGKYGSVLMYTASTHNDRTDQLAKQLCQHVIGMNPTQIECSPDEPVREKPVVKEKPVVTENPVTEETDLDEPEVDSSGDEETVMMRQTFLMDADRNVADVVSEAGLKLEDFVRFECGEVSGEPEEMTTKAAHAGG